MSVEGMDMYDEKGLFNGISNVLSGKSCNIYTEAKNDSLKRHSYDKINAVNQQSRPVSVDRSPPPQPISSAQPSPLLSNNQTNNISKVDDEMDLSKNMKNFSFLNNKSEPTPASSPSLSATKPPVSESIFKNYNPNQTHNRSAYKPPVYRSTPQVLRPDPPQPLIKNGSGYIGGYYDTLHDDGGYGHVYFIFICIIVIVLMVLLYTNVIPLNDLIPIDNHVLQVIELIIMILCSGGAFIAFVSSI